jgi:hypothetical protein
MAQRDRDNHTGRDLALLGGAALLCWLLLRGKNWGLGSGDGVKSGAAEQGANVTPTTSEPPAPCRVWLRGDRIELDGTTADLPTVVARCRAVGRADVNTAGDTIVRTIGDVVRALQVAGVVVSASPDVWMAAGVPP